MTARTAAAAASLTLALTLVACTNFYEVPIETPIQPKMDVSPFQRVLIAGFLAGGSEDVDANLETVRLLRSQLRSKSSLRVIDADVLPLIDLATEQRAKPAAPASDSGAGTTSEGTTPPPTPPPSTNGPSTTAQGTASQGTNGKPAQGAPAATGEQTRIKDEKDLQPLEGIFANVDFWKKIGEEYQNPLIVTGTVLFTPHSQAGMVQREREVIDPLGRRRVEPVREYMERRGFILQEKFIFIDGRSGAQMYSETLREEALYNQNDNTPALSSYFELMDNIIPRFLSTLSTQRVRGSRVLIK
jgi:hypothetical protein